jgi:hypothetical protein
VLLPRKIAVFAPIANAMMMTAIRANPELFRRSRSKTEGLVSELHGAPPIKCKRKKQLDYRIENLKYQ